MCIRDRSRICWRALASSATTVTCLRCAVQAVELRHQLIRDLVRRNDCDADLGRRGEWRAPAMDRMDVSYRPSTPRIKIIVRVETASFTRSRNPVEGGVSCA